MAVLHVMPSRKPVPFHAGAFVAWSIADGMVQLTTPQGAYVLDREEAWLLVMALSGAIRESER